MFLDEPTSGLDGTSSLEVMTLLKREAIEHHKCIVVVIHQPRNEIFQLLDDLLILKHGRTMYCGSCYHFVEDIVPTLDPIVPGLYNPRPEAALSPLSLAHLHTVLAPLREREREREREIHCCVS